MFVEEKAKGEVPPFKLGTLTLSMAIRVGSKIRPQTRGCMFEKGRSCALGAAWEALGFERREWETDDPLLTSDAVSRMAPIFGVSEELLDDASNLNDKGHSREYVADWLEAQGY